MGVPLGAVTAALPPGDTLSWLADVARWLVANGGTWWGWGAAAVGWWMGGESVKLAAATHAAEVMRRCGSMCHLSCPTQGTCPAALPPLPACSLPRHLPVPGRHRLRVLHRRFPRHGVGLPPRRHGAPGCTPGRRGAHAVGDAAKAPPAAPSPAGCVHLGGSEPPLWRPLLAGRLESPSGGVAARRRRAGLLCGSAAPVLRGHRAGRAGGGACCAARPAIPPAGPAGGPAAAAATAWGGEPAGSGPG